MPKRCFFYAADVDRTRDLFRVREALIPAELPSQRKDYNIGIGQFSNFFLVFLLFFRETVTIFVVYEILLRRCSCNKMPEIVKIIIAIVVTLVIAVPVTLIISSKLHKKEDEKKLDNASGQARAIIDKAVKEAEEKKREALLEVKEESIRVKNDLDKEIRERRAEITKAEDRVAQ